MPRRGGPSPLPVIPGRAKREPGIHIPDRGYGFRARHCVAPRNDEAGRLCRLRFPLHPPAHPEKSRLAELDGVNVPTLVVQGENDPFGMPPARWNRTVIRVPGNHSLRNGAAVAAAVASWLQTRFAPT